MLFYFVSLNREKRQRELLRVTQENQDVLRRIMLKQPEYDHFKWQMDWEENQRFIDMISHYPRNWWLMTKVRYTMLSMTFGTHDSKLLSPESRSFYH